MTLSWNCIFEQCGKIVILARFQEDSRQKRNHRLFVIQSSLDLVKSPRKKERKKKSIYLFAFFLFKKGRLTYSQQTRHELNSLLFLLFSGETRNSKILDSKILIQDFRLQKPILEIISVFFGLTLSFLGKCNCSYVLENGS